MNHTTNCRLRWWGRGEPGRGLAWVIADRDGTLIRECHYLSQPEQVELLPGVVRGLRMLQQYGVPVVVATNQSALGRGWIDHAQLGRIHRHLDALLDQVGVRLAGIFYCPHRPDESCCCRKPAPGLALEAAQWLGLEPDSAVVVGDKPCDVELARRLGVPALLVRTGYGARWEKHLAGQTAAVVDRFDQAAAWVIKNRLGVHSLGALAAAPEELPWAA